MAYWIWQTVYQKIQITTYTENVDIYKSAVYEWNALKSLQ